ncbi:MAG: 3-phosphoshikimate 1-carboxyvinyltransferase [Pseudomonadota bacterium]
MATQTLRLDPVAALSGTVALPGSKSLSNRALLLAALARGNTVIENLLRSDDTERMLTALNTLGVQVNTRGTRATVQGVGGPLPTTTGTIELDLGLAGTALRPLAAALTLGRGRFVLDGVARMRERPIGDLVDALHPLGARITYLGNAGYPPLQIDGEGLPGGATTIRGNVSSQFLTALLLAAPLALTPVQIEIEGDLVSRPYIDITLDAMARFGVSVINDHYQRFSIPTGGYRSPGEFWIEGDASSGSYFLAAGAIAGDGVTVTGIGSDSVQGDVAFADALASMGARVTKAPTAITIAPPATGALQAVDLDLNHIPDAAMTLAVVALFAQGTTRIRNIANWRVKETDRLSAMSTELRKLGATVDEGPDWIGITPPPALCNATIATYGDHRMAMCFSLAALGNAAVTIEDPACVDKTFPDYFEVYRRMTIR